MRASLFHTAIASHRRCFTPPPPTIDLRRNGAHLNPQETEYRPYPLPYIAPTLILAVSWNTRRKKKAEGTAEGEAPSAPSTPRDGGDDGMGPPPVGTPRNRNQSVENYQNRRASDAARVSATSVDDEGWMARPMEVDGADLIASNPATPRERTWSFNRRKKKHVEEAAAPDGMLKVYFLDGSHKMFEVSSDQLVGQLLYEVKARLGVESSNAFALYQVQRGTHYLLHEDAVVNDIRSAVDSRAKV